MWLAGCCFLLCTGAGFAESPQEPRPVEEILRALGTSKEPEKEPALAELLKRKDAHEAVLAALQASAEPEAFAGAVLVLGRLGRGSQNATRQLLAPGSDSPLQLKLLEGVGVLGARGAWLAPDVLALAEAGYAALAKGTKEGRNGLAGIEPRTSAALITLGLLGEGKRSLALAEKFLALEIRAADEPGMHCRVDAALVLWRLGGAKERVLAVLDPALDCKSDGAAVASAVFALGEMGPHAAALRTRLEAVKVGASAALRASVQLALDKIDGRQPIVGPRPAVK